MYLSKQDMPLARLLRRFIRRTDTRVAVREKVKLSVRAKCVHLWGFACRGDYQWRADMLRSIELDKLAILAAADKFVLCHRPDVSQGKDLLVSNSDWSYARTQTAAQRP